MSFPTRYGRSTEEAFIKRIYKKIISGYHFRDSNCIGRSKLYMLPDREIIYRPAVKEQPEECTYGKDRKST